MLGRVLEALPWMRKPGPVRLLRAGAAGVGAALLRELLRSLRTGERPPLPLAQLVQDAALTGLARGLVYGSLASGISPAATAYVADTTAPSERASGMALLAASGGIGTIIGPAFGGALANIGAVVPMYTAAALAVVAAVIAGIKLAEPARRAGRSACPRESSSSGWA